MNTSFLLSYPERNICVYVFICRDRAGPRKVLVTVNGVIRDPIRTPQSPASPMGGSVNDF